MSWGRRRMVLRTIHDGRVRVYGRTFAVDQTERDHSIPYTGQLDGQRWAFGIYWTPERTISGLALWGTEKAYHSTGTAVLADWPGPNCIDGTFQWDIWNPVEA